MNSEPQCRPSFQEIVEKLKDLQRRYVIQCHAGRTVGGEAPQKEL